MEIRSVEFGFAAVADIYAMRNRSNFAGALVTFGVMLPVAMIAGLAPSTAATQAATCLVAVERMAAEYRLTIDPPDARAGGVPTDRLSRSQGVIDPPPVDDAAVVQPPGGRASRMETTPDIQPDASAGTKGAASSFSAEDRLRLESILMAARSFAEAGDEGSCRERLREARKIVDSKERR